MPIRSALLRDKVPDLVFQYKGIAYFGNITLATSMTSPQKQYSASERSRHNEYFKEHRTFRFQKPNISHTGSNLSYVLHFIFMCTINAEAFAYQFIHIIYFDLRMLASISV